MGRVNKTIYKFADFDVVAFLDEYDINYKRSGKNIGTMWIGLEECPFCGVGGGHFGINLQSKSAHCWGCGERALAVKWVQQLLEVSYRDALIVIQKFLSDDIILDIRETGTETLIPTDLKPIGDNAIDYLLSRKFDPDQIVKKFRIQECGTTSVLKLKEQKSDFRWRVFIPIYMRRKLVSYTARDYTGKREPRYRHPFLEACEIPASSTIYNMDTVKDKCIIVEGPTDVWRMGDGCISLQGIEYTKEQLRYLSEMKLKKAVIMFDSGKEEQATKLARDLSIFVSKVQVAYLPSGDPGELSDSEAVKIKYELLEA